MAVLDNNEINFTGSFGRLSAYRMRGSDKIIVRAKGGPTRKQIRDSPSFAHTRLNNSEFSGAVEAVKGIRRAMILPIQRLADHNFTPRLTGICRNMQLQEKEGEKGQRAVYLSRRRELLEGFRLTQKNPFVNIVANPLSAVIDREAKKGMVQLPRLISGINLVLPWRYPAYRFVLSLGIADDVIHNGSCYSKAGLYPAASAHTAWHVNGAPFLPQAIESGLHISGTVKDTQTMILCIGLQMGAPDYRGEMEPVKHAGAACILAVG